MTGSNSATVETLTAEVRVLVVGKRQVTLSVYGQLDNVDVGDIEPFGRVKPKNSEAWAVQVIGRDRRDGTLVRSWTLSSEAISELEKCGVITRRLGGPFTPDVWEDTYVGDLKYQAEEWEALPLIVLAGLR